MATVSSVSSNKLNTIQTTPVKPKVDGRIKEILQANLSKGIAFPRKNFTSADRSYLYLTGSYFYDQQTPQFVTRKREGGSRSQYATPEYLAYRVFNEIREICKNPNHFKKLEKLIDRFSHNIQMDLYQVLYWAYKQAKQADAPQALLDQILVWIDELPRWGGLPTEFQSTKEIAEMESAIHKICKAFFKEKVKISYDFSNDPITYRFTNIMEAAWQNRPEKLKLAFEELIDFRLIKFAAEAALTMVQSHKNREKMGEIEDFLRQKIKTIPEDSLLKSIWKKDEDLFLPGLIAIAGGALTLVTEKLQDSLFFTSGQVSRTTFVASMFFLGWAMANRARVMDGLLSNKARLI